MVIKDLVPKFGRKRDVMKRPSIQSMDAWSPFRDVDRLFDDFFRNVGFPSAILSESGSLHDAFLPSVDMSENEKEVIVSVALPGVEEKDVQVELDDGQLVITGERKDEHEENDKQWHYREQRFGSFHRVIELPACLKTSDAKAKFRRGTLVVTVPKDPAKVESKHRIKVESE